MRRVSRDNEEVTVLSQHVIPVQPPVHCEHIHTSAVRELGHVE